MSDPSRLTKLPSSTTIKELITPENSATPAPEQKTIQVGIASTKDSFEAKQVNSLFTANPNTGEVNFGSGLSGKIPPIGSQNIAPSSNRFEGLLKETKSEISSYLKGGGGTASSEVAKPFRAMKEYLTLAQNEKIDNQMKEAGEKADTAMQQATTEMVTGVVGGIMSIGGAVANMKEIASKAKSDLAQNNSLAIEARFQHFTSSINDLEKVLDPPQDRKSDRVQQNILQTEQAINAAGISDSDASTSRAHRDRIRDAILDFLTKLGDANPKI